MKNLLSVVLVTLVLPGCNGEGPTHSTPFSEAPTSKSGPAALSPASSTVTGDIVNIAIGSASAQASNPTERSYDGHLAAYCVTQRDDMDEPSIRGQYLNPLSAPILFRLEPGRHMAPEEFGRIKACRRSDGSYCMTQIDLGPGPPFARDPHYTSLLDHHYISGQELCEVEGSLERDRPGPTPKQGCPTCPDVERVLAVTHEVTPSHLFVHVSTRKPMGIVRFVVKVDWDGDGVMDESQIIDNPGGGFARFELKSQAGVYQVHVEPGCGGGSHMDNHGPCCHWDYRF